MVGRGAYHKHFQTQGYVESAEQLRGGGGEQREREFAAKQKHRFKDPTGPGVCKALKNTLTFPGNY